MKATINKLKRKMRFGLFIVAFRFSFKCAAARLLRNELSEYSKELPEYSKELPAHQREQPQQPQARAQRPSLSLQWKHLPL